jgi:tetratricopeptide (TPR) repeat protein
MSAEERIEQARLLYEQAVFGGDTGALAIADQELNAVEAESLFWIGTFHQVVRHDNDAAVPALERSYELTTQAGDKLTMSYALRHLAIAEHAAGRLNAARAWLEESVRLRREIGFLPGVAANLVGLAYISAAEGRREDAMKVLDEAASIAETTGAQGIMHSIEQARTQL